MTEKMRSRMYDAMIIDFIWFLLNLEEAGHADTEALNERCQLAMEHEDNQQVDQGMEGEEESDGINEWGGPAVHHSDILPSESTEPPYHPKVIQGRVSALKATPRLTAVMYVKLLKALVQELCTDDPDVCPATRLILMQEFTTVMM